MHFVRDEKRTNRGRILPTMSPSHSDETRRTRNNYGREMFRSSRLSFSLSSPHVVWRLGNFFAPDIQFSEPSLVANQRERERENEEKKIQDEGEKKEEGEEEAAAVLRGLEERTGGPKKSERKTRHYFETRSSFACINYLVDRLTTLLCCCFCCNMAKPVSRSLLTSSSWAHLLNREFALIDATTQSHHSLSLLRPTRSLSLHHAYELKSIRRCVRIVAFFPSFCKRKNEERQARLCFKFSGHWLCNRKVDSSGLSGTDGEIEDNDEKEQHTWTRATHLFSSLPLSLSVFSSIYKVKRDNLQKLNNITSPNIPRL